LLNKNLMLTITISTTYYLKFQIKGNENYRVSPCGKVFNCKRNKQVKKIVIGSTSGFCISGKFYSLKKLRTMLEKI